MPYALCPHFSRPVSAYGQRAQSGDYAAAPWRAASCGTTDAALNQPATASALENASFPAFAAVDGNTGTRWSSAFSDPQWLQVDLGASQAICEVTLDWETAYATAPDPGVQRRIELDHALFDQHRNWWAADNIGVRHWPLCANVVSYP